MSEVRIERSAGVAVVTLDNATARNGLDTEMVGQLHLVCDAIDADHAIGAVVVRGANGTFCSGADTRLWDPAINPASEEGVSQSSSIYSAFARVGRLRVATVAAVRGAAVGAGMNLLLAADLRIVSNTARLMAGFAKIGLHPGGGFFTLSARAAGREASSALGLFAQEISGQRAAELGLAWEAVTDEEVEDRALEIATLAGRDPQLTRRTVASFRLETGPPQIPWDAAIELERGAQIWSQHRRREQIASG